MCGILCQICSPGAKGVCEDEKIVQRIKNRGPDCVQEVQVQSCDVSLRFLGSVLWMQGPELTPQPVINNSGVFLYNGDIFDDTWDRQTVSDTQLIMDKLTDVAEQKSSKELQKMGIVEVLRSLRGPFSLIYYDKTNHDLYLTRDRIGRSSLLLHRNHNSLAISSVLGRGYKCVEIPATSIHILNLDSNRIQIQPWNSEQVNEYSLDTYLEKLQNQQSVPDEEFAIASDVTLQNENKEVLVSYIKDVALTIKCKKAAMKQILENSIINSTVTKLTELLENSVKTRLETQPRRCKNCLSENNSPCSHCTIGILFSGGLDCTILAFLADKYVSKDQPIDLINVAFKKDDSSTYDVPDRLTGRQSFEELKKLCSSRKWVFREVNVPKEELTDLQQTTIADLVYPRQTILDESLGSALWFAARGKDNCAVSPCRVLILSIASMEVHLDCIIPHSSHPWETTQVLILGSGADELFGGYSRHRNAFKYHGWEGLNKELLLDWKRISFRNLARDNRVICDHGRQPRMPYLDEDFTGYVLGLPPWLRCFPCEELGPGVGDKLTLRLVAFKLGLTDVTTIPKRALQFGSRIANKKEKGSDLSMNFLCP